MHWAEQQPGTEPGFGRHHWGLSAVQRACWARRARGHNSSVRNGWARIVRARLWRMGNIASMLFIRKQAIHNITCPAKISLQHRFPDSQHESSGDAHPCNRAGDGARTEPARRQTRRLRFTMAANSISTVRAPVRRSLRKALTHVTNCSTVRSAARSAQLGITNENASNRAATSARVASASSRVAVSCRCTKGDAISHTPSITPSMALTSPPR